MQKMVIFDFIKNNSEVLYLLQRNGVKDINVALDYQAIYAIYVSHESVKSQMLRYETVAETCKTSTKTVRNAVKYMQMELI
jgi:hypothetical protein